jgi:hypothetical protein
MSVFRGISQNVCHPEKKTSRDVLEAHYRPTKAQMASPSTLDPFYGPTCRYDLKWAAYFQFREVFFLLHTISKKTFDADEQIITHGTIRFYSE